MLEAGTNTSFDDAGSVFAPPQAGPQGDSPRIRAMDDPDIRTTA